MLAERELSAQEKLGGEDSRKNRSFLYHWSIHLTDILENSVVRKQLSKRILKCRIS